MPLPPLRSRPRRLNVGDLMAVTAVVALPLAAVGSAIGARQAVGSVLSLTLATLTLDGLVWMISWRAPGHRRAWVRFAAPFAVPVLGLGWSAGVMVLYFFDPTAAICVAATALALRVYVVTWG